MTDFKYYLILKYIIIDKDVIINISNLYNTHYNKENCLC